MAVILNASTSTGFVQSADTSGVLQLQSNGSTVLTVASTGVTATNIQGTIVQGTAVASTSGTSIDFTGIPSWAKRVTVMFSGVSTSGTSPIQIQLGDAGGIETTGYVCTYLVIVNANTSSGGTSTAGHVTNSVSSSTNTFMGHTVFTLLGSNAWVGSSTITSDGATRGFTSATTKTLSDTLTQLRITTAGGTDTFDAGSINIQYEG